MSRGFAMDKKDVISFFDRMAAQWDADMIRSDAIITKIFDGAGIEEGVDSLLKPLAVCNPPPPKPSPTTPGTYVQRQGRIGAEARKAPVASPRLAQTAPSWGGSLKARQVWARRAPGRAASRQKLCQIGALSRARALPYWRPT